MNFVIPKTFEGIKLQVLQTCYPLHSFVSIKGIVEKAHTNQFNYLIHI